MTPEELKALLEKSVADIEAQRTKNAALEMQIKAFEEKLADAGKDQAKMDELANEISDLRAKMVAPVAVVTDEQAKAAFRDMAKKSYNEFIRDSKEKGYTDFSAFIKANATEQFKSLNLATPAAGGAAVAEVLSSDLIEYAREYSPILSEIGVRNGLTRDYRELVLTSYPAIADGIENAEGTAFPATATQTYGEVKADTIKVMANAPITDEAFFGATYNVYSDLVRTLGDQIGVKLAHKVIYGDGTDKNGRGILSTSRIDITDATGKSWKPSMGEGARPHDYFPVISTGVSGSLGADADAIQDLVIDLSCTLPTKYLARAKYYMNRKTKGALEKVRDADGKPVFKFNMIEGDTIRLNGYPVVLDDTMPNIAPDSKPIIFGDLSRAFAMANGDIDYMQVNPYKVQGQRHVEYNKEIFTIMQASDAILVVACTANDGAA